MALVTLNEITKTYGTTPVLRGVTWTLFDGEKVGLIGANGSGKTTLLRIILGQVEADTGRVVRARGLRCGYLAQEPDLDRSARLVDEVSNAFADLHAMEERLGHLSEEMAARHDTDDLRGLMQQYDRLRGEFETAGGYTFETRRNEILGGLGFRPRDFNLRVGNLSGGQQCRAALAKLLLRESDLLLLDEPTNHLDIEASTWLEKFLLDYAGAVVVISHDRYLLDRVVGKIAELDNGLVTVSPGTYSSYAELKRVKLLTAMREYEKQQDFIRKERRYIADVMGTQRSKQARGRRTRLERREAEREFIDKPAGRKKRLSLSFDIDERGGDRVLRMEGVGKRYGETTLFHDFSLEVSRGDKVGILGPNGCGKTTLLKMAMGLLVPDEGTSRLYENLTVGYYDQQHQELTIERTVFEEMRAVRPEMTPEQIRTFLGSFLFSGDDVFKRVEQLSGGEQSRVLLARLVLDAPHVLILDEPTNHLDIPAREVLEEALMHFEGSILLVSHDRYFLDRVVNRLMVFESGRIGLYGGNYSEYVRRKEEALAARREAEAAERAAKRKLAKSVRKPPRPQGRTDTADPYAHLSMEALEARYLERWEALEQLERRFGDPAVYQDGGRTRQLHAEYEVLRREVAELEAAWQERQDQRG